jgi:hypothetical protein
MGNIGDLVIGKTTAITNGTFVSCHINGYICPIS